MEELNTSAARAHPKDAVSCVTRLTADMDALLAAAKDLRMDMRAMGLAADIPYSPTDTLLGRIEAGLKDVRTDVDELRADTRELRAQAADMRARVKTLHADVKALQSAAPSVCAPASVAAREDGRDQTRRMRDVSFTITAPYLLVRTDAPRSDGFELYSQRINAHAVAYIHMTPQAAPAAPSVLDVHIHMTDGTPPVHVVWRTQHVNDHLGTLFAKSIMHAWRHRLAPLRFGRAWTSSDDADATDAATHTHEGVTSLYLVRGDDKLLHEVYVLRNAAVARVDVLTRPGTCDTARLHVWTAGTVHPRVFAGDVNTLVAVAGVLSDTPVDPSMNISSRCARAVLPTLEVAAPAAAV